MIKILTGSQRYLVHTPCEKDAHYVWKMPTKETSLSASILECTNCHTLTPIDVFNKANFIAGGLK